MVTRLSLLCLGTSSTFLCWVLSSCSLYLLCCGAHRVLHSFPTRRSSDLCAAHQRARHRPAQQEHLSVDVAAVPLDRKSTRLNSSHSQNSYAVFCLKKKTPTY